MNRFNKPGVTSFAPERILIFRLGSLGDTIMALPFFNRIRELYPAAEISLFTNRPQTEKAAAIELILGKNYSFSRVINYPAGVRNIFTLLALLKEIRKLKIDTVINLASYPRSKMSSLFDHFFFRMAGIKNFIGFPSVAEDFKTVDPSTGNSKWEASRLLRRLRILEPISLSEDRYWNLNLTNEEIEQARLLLGDVSPATPEIVISLGTKRQTNDWGIDNWKALVNQLNIPFRGWRLVIIGAKDETEISNACLKEWRHEGINLCGLINVRVSAAVLKRASLFVGHDSGPMHLAACVGTPCVAIFSARNLPHQWYPRGNANHIIYHKTECAGCNLDVCIINKKKCIMSITVAEVRDAIVNAAKKPDRQLMPERAQDN